VSTAQIIFIGGPHRSGTTMLADLVAQHPDVTSMSGTGYPMDEGQFVQDVYPVAPAERPGYYAFDEQAHLTEESPLVSVSSAARLLGQWQQFWDVTAKVRLEKSPPNMLRSRFLGALFPTSFQVFVLRDPLVVALASQKWTHLSLTAGVHHTLESYRILFEDLRHLPTGWMAVRYESFVRDPRPVLDAIFGAVDLSSSGWMKGDIDLDGEANARYMRLIDAPAYSERKILWFHRLALRARRFGIELSSTPREVEYVQAAFAEPMAALGYGPLARGAPETIVHPEDLSRMLG
jgi:hypothetical protein